MKKVILSAFVALFLGNGVAYAGFIESIAGGVAQMTIDVVGGKTIDPRSQDKVKYAERKTDEVLKFFGYESEDEKELRLELEAAAAKREVKETEEAAIEAKKMEDPVYAAKMLKYETVRKNPSDIQFMDNPSEAIQLEAISIDPLVIQYIENPNKKVQLTAVKKSLESYHYIKNPYKRVSRYYERNKI